MHEHESGGGLRPVSRGKRCYLINERGPEGSKDRVN